ncbi:DUF106 domain-containing protein [Candidatus Micrarchaeota archaeon]|nr:DUF106 domain-containing protein [Candidatus Micrarchaeota archaeon]
MIIYPTGYEVAVISLLASLFSNAVNKIMINRDRTEQIQARVKQLQKEINESMKNDPKADVSAKNSELMSLMKEQMNMSFKPMMFTALPFLIILSAVGTRYGPLGFVVSGVPVFDNLGWLGWYILLSFAITIAIEVIYSQYRKFKKKKTAITNV